MNELILKTPEEVLIEASIQDDMADNLIERFRIQHFIEMYSGNKLSWNNSTYMSSKGVDWIDLNNLGVINRKLHLYGWHLTEEDDPYKRSGIYAEDGKTYLLKRYTLDKYKPRRMLIIERIRAALRILIYG